MHDVARPRCAGIALMRRGLWSRGCVDRDCVNRGCVNIPSGGVMSKLLSLKSGFAVLALSLVSTLALAQQPSTVRVRGTIGAVDGPVLTIKTREGSDAKVKMTDDVAVFAVVKTSLSEIKEGSYIGVTGMPQPDGTQKAIAVHIFPENQRGAAEGFRPWDARANSTMTNATVARSEERRAGKECRCRW